MDCNDFCCRYEYGCCRVDLPICSIFLSSSTSKQWWLVFADSWRSVFVSRGSPFSSSHDGTGTITHWLVPKYFSILSVYSTKANHQIQRFYSNFKFYLKSQVKEQLFFKLFVLNIFITLLHCKRIKYKTAICIHI